MTTPPTVKVSPSPPRLIAERAARQRLLNAFLREAGQHATADSALLRVALHESGCVLLASVEHWSVLGHHAYRDEFRAQYDGKAVPVPVGHHELVALLITELEAMA
ncbi:MAG: hypothetical protein ACRDSG_02550, partial [Pseudonocardiaceae bacterium]